MSLREEIALAIHNQIALPVERVNSDKAANATNAVIAIFEKRIDKFITETKEMDKKNDVLAFSTLSAISALNDFKKEMLK